MCPSLASVSVLCVLSRENDACINSWKTFYNILSVKIKLVGFTNFVYTVFNVIGQQEHNRRHQFMELETVSHFVSPCVCLAWLWCSVEKERSWDAWDKLSLIILAIHPIQQMYPSTILLVPSFLYTLKKSFGLWYKEKYFHFLSNAIILTIQM